MKSQRAVKRAFTLIELLVVIAIISLLIGILLPAIGQARETARKLVCATTQRGLGQGMYQYAMENRDFYPGPNTSGAQYRFARGADLFGMSGNRTSSTPTTVWDWISPILGDSVNLSPNRAERTGQIFNQYGCASANFFNDKLFNSWRDRADFDRVLLETGFKQISYLSPATFHYYSSEYGRNNGPVIDSSRNAGTRYWVGFPDPAASPISFRPRLTQVGTSPSGKIFSADGTRFLAQQGPSFILDFDLNPIAETYSSFGSATPIFSESSAYGRDRYASTDLNAQLSIRHNDSINALYFDGRVEGMDATEMYSNPNPWHVSGSIFNGNRATPESIEFMEEQQGNRDEARIY